MEARKGMMLTMNRIFWTSMTLAALLCAGQIAAQENKGPKLELKELQHDFGKIVQGTRAGHVFEIRNAGNEPLIIERVQPS
jgi:hypothetical protein